MTLHKLMAGSGYDYLTRQVAALDATDKGHTGLAAYYEARGESPGVWVGSGMAGIDGLAAGDAVTAEQMANLFGVGCHPLDGIDGVPVGSLGTPFAVVGRDVSWLRIEVAKRVEAAGAVGDVGPHQQVRALIRTQVAQERFLLDHGRPPKDEQELATFLTLHTRPKTTAVAGYDLTFSPVKSVSTLWAIADPDTAKAIERAHQAAVGDALLFIETHALYTRTGKAGVRQVETTGLVATAFIHRDSRNGDPDLHTHVAVANKVQTRTVDGTPGRWLAIDGRVLFKAKVAASETYNTRLEHHLNAELGIIFADRPVDGGHLRGAKRAVREIVGVDPRLNTLWSSRRAQITDRQTDLAAEFRAVHGRPPTPVEALHLAQQANLETRQPKHHARSEADQRVTWGAEAAELLGGEHRVQRMVGRALSPIRAAPVVVDERWVDRTAAKVIGELEQRRATWQTWHVRAEAQRQIRATGATDVNGDLVDRVTKTALQEHSISLAGPADDDFGIQPHRLLAGSDGTSVYIVAGAEKFTSHRILAAEHRLLAHAGQIGAPVIPGHYIDLALLESHVTGTTPNPGQADLVRQMAASGRRVQLAIAPAGSGKTTALRALAAAWTDAGGDVLALAPSAAAVGALTDALAAAGDTGGGRNMHGDTLAKLTHTLDMTPTRLPDWVAAIGPGTLVLVDEAGMADTLTLDQVVHHALTRGATVRLIGDDQQLAAIGAGGILRDIDHRHGALHLQDLMRFTDPVEADATLGLRDGKPAYLDYYFRNGRVHVGDQLSILDDVLTAWHHDRQTGLDAVMLAPTRDQVHDLNQRAQALLHPTPDGPGARLADGLIARPGDLVITRTNNRRLRLGGTDWVKNGDRWHTTAIGTDGSLHVRHATTGAAAHLPGDYVRESVELAYATTIHTAQGTTADTMHGLLAGTETRQDLYTMATRGRHANHLYLPAGATTGDPHELVHPDAVRPQTARETLEAILDRDGAAASATTELRTAHDPATLLTHARTRYQDALTRACQDVVAPQVVAAIDAHAETTLPGLTTQPAWPALRDDLVELAAYGRDPLQGLATAAQRGRLHDVADPAAVIAWRLKDALADCKEETDGLPPLVSNDHSWRTYLGQRAEIVRRSTDACVPITDPSVQQKIDSPAYESPARAHERRRVSQAPTRGYSPPR